MDSGLWKELRDRFCAAIDDPACGWLEIWALIVEDPWFNFVLHLIVNNTRPRHRPDAGQHLADARQYVVLVLGQRLRGNRTLGFDRSLGVFKSWMEQIITRACIDFWRCEGKQAPLVRMDDVEDAIDSADVERRRALELQEQVYTTIEEIGLPHRTILMMHYRGATMREIADAIGLDGGHLRHLKKEAFDQFLSAWNDP